MDTSLEHQRTRLKVVSDTTRRVRGPTRRPHLVCVDARAPSLVSKRSPNLRLPAYAATLLDCRTQGLAPCGDRLISTDWKLGRAWGPWRIVADPSIDPERFNFTVCAGLSCLLVGRNQVHLEAVARAVVRFGPSRLVGVDYRKAQIAIYVPGALRPDGAT